MYVVMGVSRAAYLERDGMAVYTAPNSIPVTVCAHTHHQCVRVC